jgi:hypothetical protein
MVRDVPGDIMMFEVSIFANQLTICMSGEIHTCGYAAERIYFCLAPVNQLICMMMFFMMMFMMRMRMLLFRHEERVLSVR